LQNTDVLGLKVKLEDWFTNIGKGVIALSGGIDSSLVAFVARQQLGKENVVAVISASASVKMKELTDAQNFCKQFDIDLLEIDAREIEDQNYLANPVNRCYFCKSALYSKLDELINSRFKGYTVLNGNNFSDLGDFRPGLEAAGEHKVLSPLANCHFTKDDIRLLAKFYNLPNWSKPASPCLSSRFPYGEAITATKLKMVEKAEDTLNSFGFIDVRVRYIQNTGQTTVNNSYRIAPRKTARIEVPASEIEKLKACYSSVEPILVAIGFDHCEIDPEGLVSGKLNRKLTS
jgi:pyridinium-3,5-biscarboxylic acid mononucleotide sulfurtransferase